MEKALPSQLNDFVDSAKYQQIVEDMLKIAKQQGASQAEVGLNASVGLNVSVRLGNIDILEFNRDKAIGVTVYLGQRKGAASTTELSSAALRSIVEAAVNIAKLTEPDPFSGLAEEQEMAKIIHDLDLYHPWDLGVENAVGLARTCEEYALKVDKRITNSQGATLSTGQSYHVYGNSHGFIGCYPTSKHNLSCIVIAEGQEGMERDFEYTSARHPDLLTSPQAVGQEAAFRVLRRLGAKKLSTQKVPVLFHARIASSLLGHFITSISGSRLFRETSFLTNSLNQIIFPEHIHLYERPHIKSGVASAPFDNDGIATFDKDFVIDGRVSNYVLGTYSARKLKMKSTANAGGVHNLFIQTGNEDLPALLKKMNKGLLVTELMGQGINLVTGDYSRGAFGFWVENGEIQYPVHEITIAGNLKNMFKQFIAIGNDIDKRSGIQTGSILVEEMTVAGV